MPEHAADAHPVETNYALCDSNCHIHRSATEAFSTVMVTHGNGELYSKLLYNAINWDYMQRINEYFSMAKEKKWSTTATINYLQSDGEFIRSHPPLGDTIRGKACTMQRHQVGRIIGMSVIMTNTSVKSRV